MTRHNTHTHDTYDTHSMSLAPCLDAIGYVAVALELVVTRIPNVVDLNLSACEIVPAVLNCIGERCRALLHLNLSHTAITATDVANILNRTRTRATSHKTLCDFSNY